MFETFLQEKQYLTNVSPRTLEWFKTALTWLDTESPDDRALKTIVIKMRAAGVSPRSINSYRTGINSYLHWTTGTELKCSPQCKHPKIPKMRVEERILPTFKPEDIRKLVDWKAKNRCQKRIRLLLLTLVDTGSRIEEALGVTWKDCDLDALLIRVIGKGNKERQIPFSIQLRKVLFATKSKEAVPSDFIFSTRDGRKLNRRNMLRDAKIACKRLGIQVPERTLHSMRHTYAINALRRGASVFHIQKQLGHRDISMSRRYANLLVDDLVAMHPKITLLA